jgi:hypothetical protein
MSRKPSPGFTVDQSESVPGGPQNVCIAQSSLSTAVAETLFWKLKYLGNQFWMTTQKNARYLKKVFPNSF